MSEHDHSYKLLFSQTTMVKDLLRGFVHEAWVEEMRNMLAETVQQWYAEAESQGHQQGLQQGKLEGDRLVFKLLLQAKFGSLSLAIEEQIQVLDAETLLPCAQRLLTATTIEEVFTDLP